ncbi:DUF4861 domain-containing protein [Salegentibacter sp. LM13S]|uniref:DUF4861 domain-containing protein n=1 Tax=Salegentibacter lacus TaxID=2873599 RepID=UPI001CCC27D5|nr:DUF4861 domain-containing protein [Salegentibacter lacus]MBZ9630959.1 DUF4861 domain-containing protein [Salegentibacter lacus]
MAWNKPIYSALFSAMLISASTFFVSCQSRQGKSEDDVQKKLEIRLKNLSPIALEEKAISIPRDSLRQIDKSNVYPLVLGEKGDTIPAQLDDLDGDGEWDELFFLLDFAAKEQTKISLDWISEKIDFQKRTNIRFGVRDSLDSQVKPASSDTFYADELPGVMGYQPYQTDGPSWENDKVGFRHYLDGRNSKDVFGKKISAMSPDSVGINKEGVTEDDYHVMEDWGRDILSVGKSVGIGGFGLKIGDTLARIGVTQADSLNNVDQTRFEILSDGHIRALMQYEYKNWQPEAFERSYEVNELSSIWPGMYAFKNQVSFNGLKGDEIAVVGLVNSNTEKPLTSLKVGDYTVLFTHDKQTYDKEWYLGLALLVPNEIFIGYSEAPKEGRFSQTYVAELELQDTKPIEYFAIAAWELSDPGFAKESYFKDYLIGLANQLSAEIEFSVQ